MVAPTFAVDRSVPTYFGAALQQLQHQTVRVSIWQQHKTALHLRVYLTDENGIVRFDSRGRDVGKNYARWNDVYLTLRGHYGTRTTRDDPADEFSSTMYVAAPIKQNDRIIGVLTVAVPNRNHQPYLVAAEQQLKRYGLVMIVLSLAIGMFTTYWLIRSLRAISDYAERISHEPGLPAPQFARGTELEKLMQSLQTLRETLDGKSYVEDYVHALTHELKSPLAAIKAAQEILHDKQLDEADRARFSHSIDAQTERMQQLIDQLLLLAKIEQRRMLESSEPCDLNVILQAICQQATARVSARKLTVKLTRNDHATCRGDGFLLRLALNNLLENAINHAESGSEIRCTLETTGDAVTVRLFNRGDAIPDYALPRLGERFYALTRADGQRGSGLGLRVVNEVARLHGGHCSLVNADHGVVATLVLPRHMAS